MKTDYENETRLYVVYPDDEPTAEMDYTRYKYSDELFDWFYAKLKYYGFSTNEWDACVIDEKWTRKDNSRNGCRITFLDGNYIKFYETYFLMEFTNGEWSQIDAIADNDVTMEDVINYFYSIPK